MEKPLHWLVEVGVEVKQNTESQTVCDIVVINN